MPEQHYAHRERVQLIEKSEILKLYALVDGIQYDRFFDEPLEEAAGVRSLFSLPEDKVLACAGPWLLDESDLSQEHLTKIRQLERNYPAVSWLISEQPFFTLARHFESSLRVSLPSKETGLFRFYDCRVLKMLPELLSSQQMTHLMKYAVRWIFLYEGKVSGYQIDRESLSVSMLRSYAENKEKS